MPICHCTLVVTLSFTIDVPFISVCHGERHKYMIVKLCVMLDFILHRQIFHLYWNLYQAYVQKEMLLEILAAILVCCGQSFHMWCIFKKKRNSGCNPGCNPGKTLCPPLINKFKICIHRCESTTEALFQIA